MRTIASHLNMETVMRDPKGAGGYLLHIMATEYYTSKCQCPVISSCDTNRSSTSVQHKKKSPNNAKDHEYVILFLMLYASMLRPHSQPNKY